MPDDVKTVASLRSAAKILVVDDEPFMRRIILRWLSEAGYECAQAESAAVAMQYLETHDVHLVTLDITMPGLTGAELLPRIKSHCPDVEVIMLTALQEVKLAVDTLTQGAYAYLMKPVETEELLFQVKKALERRQLIIEKREYTHGLEEKVRHQTEALRLAHEETILRLVSASRYRDEETGMHIRRTGLYCELLAEVQGWSATRVDTIRMAAPMHDVGKIGIPDAILQKPGPLTPPEFEIMKTHAAIGAEMLADSESDVLQMAHGIALCHHERWDGRGYPSGLVGEAIPEPARMLAIVDVYDALTHDRIYRRAMPEEQALEIMEKGRGSHFDPFLFSVFTSLVPEMRRIARENRDEAIPEAAPPRETAEAVPVEATVG